MRICLAATTALALGLAPCAALQAGDLAYTGRVGLIAGAYEGKGAIASPQTDRRSEIDGSFEASYGGTVGVRVSNRRFDRWQFDAAIDAIEVEYGDSSEANRTDLLFSGNYAVLDSLSILAGYRLGWQGDGLFDDEILSESGPFAGLGFGGLTFGPRIGFAASAAYNFNRLDLKVNDGDRTRSLDFSYPGFSINASLLFLGTPHAIRLRFQQFDGDTSFSRDNPDVQGSREEVFIEAQETYIQLFYIFALGA
ncbi:MAG: hypothetical protein ACT4QA_20585 [Panacagrimonas sp.]